MTKTHFKSVDEYIASQPEGAGSAQGAARTINRVGNMLAPRSVVRDL